MRLNTSAFGIGGGSIAATAVFVLTFLLLVRGFGGTRVLAESFLFGYSVSVAGAFIGAMWAYAYGFVFGVLFAFVYNLAIAPSEPPIDEG